MLSFSKNRPHALLITGDVASIAEKLAPELKALLCENFQSCTACGECASCHLYDSEDGHPDLLMRYPEGKINMIKIDHVREVIDFLSQSALRGGLRIVVFVEADALNIASQNALLKSLEEPGAKTMLILITQKPHLLLPTIKSRCQFLKIDEKSSLPNDELEQLLRQKPFEIIALTQTLKDTPLNDVIEAQMRILYDAVQHTGHNQLALHHLYDSLIEARELLQKQVAINAELMLAQLLMKWQSITG